MPTPSWDRLRIIGNSKLIKLTTIMPLIGYLIVFNHHVVSALHLENSLFGSITEEFLILRLRLLYFGLFLTGVGSALFTIFCPSKIKQYTDAVELAQRELHFLPIPHFYSLLEDLTHVRNPAYADIDIDEYRDRLATNEDHALETVKIQILTESYWSQSHRFPLVRWATFLSFLCGFSLLFYPSATTLVSVLRATF
jgi:hypothetical protein